MNRAVLGRVVLQEYGKQSYRQLNNNCIIIIIIIIDARFLTEEWRKLHNEELSDMYSLPNIVRVVKFEE